MPRTFAIPFALALSIALNLFATRAHARGSAQLAYSRGVDTGNCPDEVGLRNAVSTRLGYDPFRVDAPV